MVLAQPTRKCALLPSAGDQVLRLNYRERPFLNAPDLRGSQPS